MPIWRLAADKGHAEAPLGVCYEEGLGVSKDEREAARLFRLAADKGDARGLYELGKCRGSGKGVLQDMREAARLFRLAADQGVAPARITLGRNLISGSAEPLVPRQLREGALLLAQAAQQQLADGDVQQKALDFLGAYAHERDVAHACCIDCGKSKGLKVCGKCRVGPSGAGPSAPSACGRCTGRAASSGRTRDSSKADTTAD